MEALETVMIEVDKLRYPVGRFEFGKEYNDEDIQNFIKKIDEFPAKLKKAILGVSQEQLETRYREGGWTIRQVIHHLADSHINAYTRFRLALTEEIPVIKPYDEKSWAELDDAKTAAPAASIDLLTGLHKRWAFLLKSMKPEDFSRLFYHPEHQTTHSLLEILAMYAWHCDHHYNHIQQAKGYKTATKAKPEKPKKVIKRIIRSKKQS